MGFIYGHNTPGYLPESDDDCVYATFDDAKRGLIDDILRHADNVDDEDYAIDLSNAAEDINLWSSPDSVTVYDPGKIYDLGTVYWVEFTDSEATDDY